MIKVLKKIQKTDIIDQKRINVILKNIRKKSLKNKLDVEITQIIWKAMIKAFIDYDLKILTKNNYLL